MDTAKTCYLFFDLDGTVLTHDRRLEKETLDAMLRVQAMGHKLIMNTGRSRGGYLRKNADAARIIPWDGTCFSASDIIFEDQLLYENGVSWEDFSVWLEYCMEKRLDLWYCGRLDQQLLDFSRYASPMTNDEMEEWRKTAERLFGKNTLTNVSIMGVLEQEGLPESGLQVCQLPTYSDLFSRGMQ